MKKNISILIVLFLTQITFAQKPQKIGYVDREYILENVPEYKSAQSKLNAKISNWTSSLDKIKSKIEEMKLTLINEKALLTSDLITEREEDIIIKEEELKTQQEAFFGTSGDLFMLRKQLVKPVQDQIFNAIQEIVKSKKYDIIFDKSSNDLVMLYTNPKYDVSELVLQKIVKGRKKKENEKKKSDRETAKDKRQDDIKKAAEARMTNREKLQARVKKEQAAKLAKREAAIKANKERREKKIAEAKAAREKRIADAATKREALKNKGSKNKVEVDKETSKQEKVSEKEKNSEKEIPSKIEVKKEIEDEKSNKKTKAELKAEKISMLKERAIKNTAKRDSLRKVAAAKRAKRLAEIKERRKQLEENKNN